MEVRDEAEAGGEDGEEEVATSIKEDLKVEATGAIIMVFDADII